ncbi:MAG TPA: hypothetical protein PLE45_03590 [Spirochaetota bacterium]|nr:hypothetical protein [Spirochaetota bacterium]HOL56337.1 hypothetical protein [Spirochaetota bacterium]HPP03546.1 hypothetical protein [Spirochaetota bacterium]
MDLDSKMLFQWATTAFQRLKEIDKIKTKNQFEIEKNEKLREIYKIIIEKVPHTILKLNRNIPYLYYFYGVTLYYLNKNSGDKEIKENAIRLIKTAIQKTPVNQSYIEYEKELVNILINERKINEAISYCFHILQSLPNDKFYLGLTVDLLLKVNRIDEAIQLQKKIISFYPFEYQHYTELGRIYFIQKNYEDALQLFIKAKDIEPKAPENYKYIGKILLLQNRKAIAGSNFKTAIARKIYNHNEYLKNLKIFGPDSNKLDENDNELNTLLFLFECYRDLILCGEDYSKELDETGKKLVFKGYLKENEIEILKKRGL